MTTDQPSGVSIHDKGDHIVCDSSTEKPQFYQKPLQTNNLIGLLQISFPALFKTIHQMAFPAGTA